MMFSQNILNWCSLLVIVSLAISVIGQDFSFGFPESPEEDKRKQNSDNKLPIFIPGRCGENEFLYPGDQKDDWVCDCKPGFLYYPMTDRCYNAYRQGPCMRNQFLVLPLNKNIPECRLNSCRRDGSVKFQNRCYDLDTAGPCQLPELSYVIGVNASTLELSCIRQRSVDDDVQINDRFGPDDSDAATTTTVTESQCYKGGKRWIDGKCKDQK